MGSLEGEPPQGGKGERGKPRGYVCVQGFFPFPCAPSYFVPFSSRPPSRPPSLPPAQDRALHPSLAPKAGSHCRWNREDDLSLTWQVKWFLSRGQAVSWSAISSMWPQRTARACEDRWKTVLDPAIKKGRWSQGGSSFPPSFSPSFSFPLPLSVSPPASLFFCLFFLPCLILFVLPPSPGSLRRLFYSLFRPSFSTLLILPHAALCVSFPPQRKTPPSSTSSRRKGSGGGLWPICSWVVRTRR
jgi:hypothetical protein